MDLWRVLLLGALVVGVVVLLLPAPEVVPGLVGGMEVEAGTYVLERGDLKIGEESFTLWLAEGMYRLESSLRQGGEATEATLVLDRAWNPLYYVERGRGSVSVRIVEGRPRVGVGAGLFRREIAFPVLPPFAFLGVDVVTPWFAVYRHAQMGGGAVTAVMPGERVVRDLAASPPERVGLRAGGRVLPAEIYRVQMGSDEILLYGQGELLLGGSVPGTGLVFYLKEMLPDGIREER